MADKPGSSSSFPAKSFYSSCRKNLSRLSKRIAAITCASDSEDDISDDDHQDPEFTVPLLSESESESEYEEHEEVTTTNECDEGSTLPTYAEDQSLTGKENKNTRTKNDRMFWGNVRERQLSNDDLKSFESIINVDTSKVLPLDYFKQFISDEVVKKICDFTNLYAIQKNINKPLAVSSNELEQWMGISFYMSITKITLTRLHWSNVCLNDKIASIMSRQRWEDIKRNLHFVNNEEIDNNDKLAKVRFLVDHLRNEFKKFPMKEHLSVDEQIVPFKGRSSLKQYIPKKPYKWGYKIFVLADDKGFVYDFIPYCGKILPVESTSVPDLGPSSNSVLHLAQCIPDGMNHKLYCDNWFTSIKLIDHLASRKIWVCGTIQERRIPNLKFKADKQLKAEGRGSYDEWETETENATITALKWLDNKTVCLASSFETSFPTSTCERFDKKNKQYVNVPIPNIIKEYNQHMGGVDLFDQLLSYFRMTFRSKKYYLRLVFHLLDVAVVNSWLLYRRAQNEMKVPHREQYSLGEFKLRLANSLMMAGKNLSFKRGRPSASSISDQHNKKKLTGRATQAIPEQDVRRDGIGHYPAKSAERRACKNPGCKGKIKMYCMKCLIHLCCEPDRNCFLVFHCD